MRYIIQISYQGTAYHGWQIQPNGITIQGVLVEALERILRQKSINLVGCGRTDTGVHARNFIAHFDMAEQILDTSTMVYKLNSYLPKDIYIHDLKLVADDFHARFDATSRTYRYYIVQRKDPFRMQHAWYYYGELNMELMNQASEHLFKYTDFTSFSKLHTQVKTNNCKISKAIWRREGHQLIFEIRADRFLRNMVRAIVGTLVQVGKGELSPDGFAAIIEAKNRQLAGESAPAQGLFLEEISYDSIQIN